MTTRTKRILLAEDELALRDFVSRNLRARGFEVLEASNGLEAMALWEREEPHLLILDIMMPRMDGLEVCRRVREHSDVSIIVLTALDAESDKVTALDLGADDYLTKPFGVEELLARIRVALRHTLRSGTDEPVFRTRGLTVDIEHRRVTVDGEELHLTPTEYALLTALVRHADRVVTDSMLLQEVWGPEYGDED